MEDQKAYKTIITLIDEKSFQKKIEIEGDCKALKQTTRQLLPLVIQESQPRHIDHEFYLNKSYIEKNEQGFIRYSEYTIVDKK